MNEINEINNINQLVNNSYYKILNFKSDLYKLYDIIFHFCSKNNIIIHNYNINISNLNNIEYKLYDINNDFNFNLLSINPYKNAIELANILFIKYSKYIMVSSYLSNKEIIISIDNNKIIKFQLLFLYSDKIITKIKIPNYNLTINNNKININYSSNLLQILILSQQLYHPSYFIKYINSESNLLNNIKDLKIDGFDIKDIYITLLKDIININYIYDKKNNNNLRFNLLKYLITTINVDNYIDNKIILLDNHALEYLNHNNNNNQYNNNNKNIYDINFNNILNILINTNSLEFLINIFNNYLKDNNLDNEYKIIKNKSNTYIINDFRLTKYNIILKNINTSKTITLIIAYNTIEYEIIPIIYTFKNILIPHPIVINRFIILNLFNLQLFDSNYNINTYYQSINKIQYSIKLEKEINKNILNKKIIIKYYGTFIDERIDKFTYGSNIYRPWQYQIKNGNLLKI